MERICKLLWWRLTSFISTCVSILLRSVSSSMRRRSESSVIIILIWEWKIFSLFPNFSYTFMTRCNIPQSRDVPPFSQSWPISYRGTSTQRFFQLRFNIHYTERFKLIRSNRFKSSKFARYYSMSFKKKFERALILQSWPIHCLRDDDRIPDWIEERCLLNWKSKWIHSCRFKS